MTLTSMGIELVERGLVPDMITRKAIRNLCAQRLSDARAQGVTDVPDWLREGPIALVPEKANEQHYELPAEFFKLLLGPRRKYSCCYFPYAEEGTTLAEAEIAALTITCQRAELADGQRILELGCGWGSLTLWMAERYPNAEIVAVSNSASQRKSIEADLAERGLTNVLVVTADMNDFDPGGLKFDRIVSVEMFEHMHNYEALLERLATWLAPRGKMLVHIFCHRELTYPFETEGDANWMGRYFFTGGLMPSAELLTQFPHLFRVRRQFYWNGRHYQRTADAWLAQLDARRDQILPILADAYGAGEARRWLHRWRMFLLAVSELFGYANGEEWFVSHYLMEPVREKGRRWLPSSPP